jgi:uncharacterized protein (DUF302 family)
MNTETIVTLACVDNVDAVLGHVVIDLEKRHIELFAVIDHSGEADEVGLRMPDTKLVIFGSPVRGTPLMVAHPLLALDLPLKLLIWETQEHQTFVSYNAPEWLADRHGLSASELDGLRAVETIAQAAASPR